MLNSMHYGALMPAANPNIERFTSSGTWAKPSKSKVYYQGAIPNPDPAPVMSDIGMWVHILCVGAGYSGGSSTPLGGIGAGGGGSSGATIEAWFRGDELPDTLNVTVGTTPGASSTVTGTNFAMPSTSGQGSGGQNGNGAGSAGGGPFGGAPSTAGGSAINSPALVASGGGGGSGSTDNGGNGGTGLGGIGGTGGIGASTGVGAPGGKAGRGYGAGGGGGGARNVGATGGSGGGGGGGGYGTALLAQDGAHGNTTGNGGAGAPGIVIITTYSPTPFQPPPEDWDFKSF